MVIKHVEIIDFGDNVVCDQCNKDYTNSDAVGGFLFGSHGVCPECVPRMEEGAKKYHEEHFITERAREGETFKAFCLRLRDGNNEVRITTFTR